MKPCTIDLNADMGESPEALADGADAELMRYITSANIACGGHAGDEQTMLETLLLARRFGVAAGAHPSFPDPRNFGRVAMDISVADLEASLVEQIQNLQKVAKDTGVTLIHVKPHGALYHAANRSAEVATTIARAARECDPNLILVGQAGSSCLGIWREMGFATAAEAFADRAYEADGMLRKRTLPGALLAGVDETVAQGVAIACERHVKSVDGAWVALEADTLCLHSDTPGAAENAKRLRAALERAGCVIKALRS